jgi:5'(3')-deoxyribonucleotidase
MKKLAIITDLDGIVADLHAAWLDDINRRAGTNLTKADIHTYQMEQVVPKGVDVYAFLNTPGAYETLPRIDGACEMLEQLQDDGHTIFVASHPVPREESTAEKLRWCKANLPWLSRSHIYIGGPKDRILADAFIDDDPKNLRAFRARQPQAFLATIAWPYNAEVESFVNLRAPDFLNTDVAWRTIYQHLTLFAQTGDDGLAQQPQVAAL